MPPNATSSRRPSSELFPRAALRIISSQGTEKKSCDVVLALSHRIYWKVVKSDSDATPKSLFDFRKQSSLELKRLDTSATWKDVEGSVKQDILLVLLL